MKSEECNKIKLSQVLRSPELWTININQLAFDFVLLETDM